MSEIKWIKIVTDIFDDEKILLIETLPEADSIIVIWFKLLCLAGKQNNSGVFVMNGRIPYTDKMLATIFRRKETIVKLALETFKNFEMIEIIDDVITIPNWEKHQKLDQLELVREQTRKRVAKYREKQKLLVNGKSGCNVTSEVTVTQSNADRIDKIRKDKNKKEYIYYGEYKNVFFTNKQFNDLKNLFPSDYKERIQKLDDYMQSTGKKYKDCLATLRNWARKEGYKFNIRKEEYKTIEMSEEEYQEKMREGGKKYV